MKFEQTPLAGAWLIESTPFLDSRGAFGRAFCTDEFAKHGLKSEFVQHNLSENIAKGTLRGMHWQYAPHAEIKLVRCLSGAIYDVIVDMRPESPTYRHWYGVELSAENRRALYIPEGFAHGFLTLTDDVVVYYLHSTPYAPGAQGAMRYDDPGIGIAWPAPVRVISEKDANLADFDLGLATVP